LVNPLWTDLQQTHAAVVNASGITAWLANIANAKASAVAINATRTSDTTNPFQVIQLRLADVSASTTDIKTNKLTNLSSTIDRFNGMWYNNASLVFDSLLGKAVFVNSSIMELDSDVAGKITTMNTSLVQINSLYSGDKDLNAMPEDISRLADNLTLPDTTQLTARLQSADQNLADSGADLAHLIAALDNLTSALQSLQPAVASIDGSVSDFDADDTTWPALQADLAGANGLQVSVTAAIFNQADLGAFASSTAGSIKQTMDGASGDMSSQVTSIGEVQQSISNFNMGEFTSALDNAASAYDTFGGNPSTVSGASYCCCSWLLQQGIARTACCMVEQCRMVAS
jgi:hypothetical protein